jgi:hypothetical protein
MRIFSGIMLLFAAAAWPQQRQGASAMSFTLSSTAFPPGGRDPQQVHLLRR